MVRVNLVERKSAVLTPSSLACLSRMPTINLTAGCAHGCIYCYARGYRTYPGDESVTLYANTLSKLRAELSRKRAKPAAVYFSPSSDVFQPVPEVLNMGYDIFEFLLKRGIGVAFLTKGRIPPRHMDLLRTHAPLVRAQVGLTTLDDDIRKMFEAYSSPPDVRLAQAGELIANGIWTRIRLDPILPGLTDDGAGLEILFRALEDVGVDQIAASILFLRTGVMHSIKKHLQGTEMLSPLLAQFRTGKRISIHAAKSQVIALPLDVRRAIFDRVRQAAYSHGISVHLCSCKNPDLATEPCGIAGEWNAPAGKMKQLSLFDETERE